MLCGMSRSITTTPPWATGVVSATSMGAAAAGRPRKVWSSRRANSSASMSPTTPITIASRAKRSATKRRRSAAVMAGTVAGVPLTGRP